MADLITELGDDDIRTEWAGSPTVSEGDDDASDTPADDDGTDATDAADTADTTDTTDTSDEGGGDADATDA